MSSAFAAVSISIGSGLSRTVFEYTKLIKDHGGSVSNVVTEKARQASLCTLTLISRI